MSTPDTHSIAKFAVHLAELSDREQLIERLCEASMRTIGADGATMTLYYLLESRLRVFASGERARSLDDLQDVVGEGPSVDAARAGSVTVGHFGANGDDRWLILRERLMHDFAGSLLAIPVSAQGTDFGVLTLHRETPRDHEDLGIVRVLAGILGAAFVDDPQFGESPGVIDEAWELRSLIHQASGMIVAQTGVRPEDAAALLRGQAFARAVSLAAVAREIIDRRINFRHFTIKGD